MDSAILREEALKLSPYDRALLADTLMASLEADLSSERIQKWADESEDRLAAYHRGDLESVEGESVFKKLRSDLAQ